MRVLPLVTTASALLSQKAVESPDSLQKEFEAENAEHADKIKELGTFDQKRVDSEVASFSGDVQKAKAEGLKKMKDMTNDKALSMLSGKMSASQVSTIKAAMNSDDEALSREQMLVKAMQALNDMFLSVDDERIQTMTDCTVELTHQWKTLRMHYATIRQLETMMGEAASNFRQAAVNAGTAYREKDKLLADKDATVSAQNVAMGKEEAVLEEIMKDVSLYRFIMNEIKKECKPEEKKAFVAITDAQEKCMGGLTMNDAILKIFANEGTLRRAEAELDSRAYHSLQDTMKRIHQDVQEAPHGKYSFLQKASDSKQPWMLRKAQGSTCGNGDDLDCMALASIVGQELECNKQLMREQQAVINKLNDEQAEERDAFDKQIGNKDSLIEQLSTLMGNYKNEFRGYNPPRWEEYRTAWREYRQNREKRWDCYLRIFELETNYYCAVKHLRSFMKGLTLDALKVTDEDVQDCTADEFMAPDAECLLPGNQTHTPCIPKTEMPKDEALLPKTTWRRDVTQFQKQSEKASEATGGEVIAMDCPRTMSMNQTCNTFLCPIDCAMSEWGDWAKCTADCDSGSTSRTRRVISSMKHGGQPCGDVSETAECNTQSCDVDCVLHEDWVSDEGCLQACSSDPADMRYEMIKRPIAIEAIGNGECPEKHSPARIDESVCQPRTCNGDEVCMDVMDLAIVYECSATTTRLGCWMVAAFIYNLLRRMPTVAWDFPTMKIALIKFGNGASLPAGDGSYVVAPAHPITAGFETNTGWSLIGKMFMDTWRLWSGKTTYTLGYNNLAQGLEIAKTFHENSQRTEANGVEPNKKVLIITKGKRAGCTPVKGVSEELKEKGVVVDTILVNKQWFSNPDEFEVFEEVVSYPFKAHYHQIAGLAKFADWGFLRQTSQGLIPKICPDSASPRKVWRDECSVKAAIVHKGRSCPNWNLALSDGPLTLQECRDAAHAKEYKGFVFTFSQSTDGSLHVGSDEEAYTSPNCFVFNPKYTEKESEEGEEAFIQKAKTHEGEDPAKVAQTDAKGVPVDTTCTYVPQYGEKEPKKYTGWLKQEPASGDGKITNHYRVLASKSDCGSSLWRWKRSVLKNNWNDLTKRYGENKKPLHKVHR